MAKLEIEIDNIAEVAAAVGEVEGRIEGASDEEFLKDVLAKRLIALTGAGKQLLEAKKLSRSDYGIKGQYKSKEVSNEIAEPQTRR